MTISTVISNDGLTVTTINTNDFTGYVVTTILHTDTSNIKTTVQDANGNITSNTTDVENIAGNLITTTTYPLTMDYVISTSNSNGVMLDITTRVTDPITKEYSIMVHDLIEGSFSSENYNANGTSISTTDTTLDSVTLLSTSTVVYSDTGSTLTTVTDSNGNAVTITTIIIDSVTGYETTSTVSSANQTTTSVTQNSTGNVVSSVQIDLSDTDTGTISTTAVEISAVTGATTVTKFINDITGVKPVLVSSVVNVTNTVTAAVISNVLITYDSSGNYVTVSTNSSGIQVTTLSNAPVYAFYAAGGFSFGQGFDPIITNDQSGVNKYDMTNAVQISFNTQTLNKKLGVFKASDKITLVDDALKTGEFATRRYDADNDVFVESKTGVDVSFNEITLSSTEFNAGVLLASQIISVGALDSLYADFVSSVRSYFGYSGGFASLFQNAETFDISGGTTFGAAAFLELLSLSAISGTIAIPDIVECLRFTVDANVFNNRAGLNTSTDITNRNNYGVGDGFMPGDMIWIQSGIIVNLSVGIESELVDAYLNNIGPIQMSYYTDSYLQSGALFSDIITSSLNKIAKTMTAPVVLVLSDSA